MAGTTVSSPTNPSRTSSGEPTTTQHVTALLHGDERIGQLVVGARRGERQLPNADRAILDLLASRSPLR